MWDRKTRPPSARPAPRDRGTGSFIRLLSRALVRGGALAPHPGVREPGRSRDYSLELTQIRACTLNAPGSSHCGIAVPHTTGWFRGDTLVRHGILGVVPP